MIYLIQTLTSTSTLRPNWLINLKILHMFNMAQDAYHVAKAMRDMGLNADILIPILNVKSSTIDRNSTIADPAWENPQIKDAPWIKRFYLGGNISRATRLATLYRDRKSTRLNSSHGYISYAVF